MFKLYEMKIVGASFHQIDIDKQAVLNWSDKTQWVLNYCPIKSIPVSFLVLSVLTYNISDIAGRRMGSLSTGRCTATGCCSSPAGGHWSSPVRGLRISVSEVYFSLSDLLTTEVFPLSRLRLHLLWRLRPTVQLTFQLCQTPTRWRRLFSKNIF